MVALLDDHGAGDRGLSVGKFEKNSNGRLLTSSIYGLFKVLDWPTMTRDHTLLAAAGATSARFSCA